MGYVQGDTLQQVEPGQVYKDREVVGLSFNEWGIRQVHYVTVNPDGSKTPEKKCQLKTFWRHVG